MKKFLALCTLAALCLLTLNINHAFAEEKEYIIVEQLEDYTPVETNNGVSDEIPVLTNNDGGISIMGVNPPGTVHNLVTDGQLDFQGSATRSELYSDKIFTGKSPIIKVTNYHSSEPLTVKIMDANAWSIFDQTKWTYTLEPGTSVFASTSLDSSGKYYLKFSAPSNFSGYVK